MKLWIELSQRLFSIDENLSFLDIESNSNKILIFQILKLSNNQLHTLDQDLFEHLPNLEYLSIDSNPIMTIDHLAAIALSDIPHLKVRNTQLVRLITTLKKLFSVFGFKLLGIDRSSKDSIQFTTRTNHFEFDWKFTHYDSRGFAICS